MPQFASIAVATLVIAGCGKSGAPWETVYKTSGQLLFKGQPIEGAQLTLYPNDSSAPAAIRPTATTDNTGKFILSTYRKEDGAPAGDYRVAVIWHPLIAGKGGEPSRGPNKLPARYAAADTSALNVRVEKSATNLPPIELKP